MEGQKLFQLLSTLSKPELNQLEKLVISPFFNKNKHIITLFYFLKPYYPSFDFQQKEKADIHRAVFPNLPFHDARLRNIMSDLTVLAEQFLVWQKLETEPFTKTRYLIAATKERNIDKAYRTNVKRLAQVQENSAQRDVAFYFNQHQLMEEQYEFTAKNKDRALEHSLQQLTDNLDIYYLSKKLKYSCEMINRTNVFSEKYEMGLFNEVMDYLKNRKHENVPIIRIYYQILLTLLYDDVEAHYFELKHLLEEYSHLFRQEDNKMNYGFAQNYCIKKINSGRTGYLKELFVLYQLSLANKVIFEGEQLSQWDYKNITTVGLRLGETQWIHGFIHQYNKFIDKKYQENAFKYNLANYHFYQKEFSDAMKLLLQVAFTDIYYNLDSRSLLLKVYFELGEFEALLAHAEAFKNYLRRISIISAYQKKIYMNSVKYTSKLAKYQMAWRTVPKKLVEEVNNTPDIADSTWLRNKVASL